jgi:membrane-associated phospholipid phosphatase
MTVATGDSADQTALRRCLTHVEAAQALLVRPLRGQVRNPWPIDWRQVGIAAGACVIILLFGMFFIDGPIMRAVTHLPRWIVWIFEQITDFGKSGWFLWPLGVLFLALAALPATLPRIPQLVLAAIMVRVGFLFVAIGLPSLFDTVIKRIIGRARPLTTNVIDPTLFKPFIWRSDYASLPSGHATTAFAVLVAFGTLWPRSRTIFLVYALLIAVSRVVVSGHYPTDVLAGAVVGTIGAIMVRRWFALRHLGFSVGPDGVVHQRPGPTRNRIKAVARDLLSE